MKEKKKERKREREREKENNTASAPRLIGNEITCFLEIAHSHRGGKNVQGVPLKLIPPSSSSIFKSVIPILELEPVNFDNHG